MKRGGKTLASMATVHEILRKSGSRALLSGLVLGATGAVASGDRPPEGKEQPPAVSAACQDSKAGGTPGGSAPSGGSGACDAPGRSSQSPSDAEKSRATRPDRYGTGYEARKGLGSGGGRGRGRGR